MVNFFRNNFLLFPSLLLAIFLYSGLVKIPDQDFYSSLIPLKDVVSIEGQAIGNPTVMQGGMKACKIRLLLTQVSDKNGLVAKADGRAELFVPLDLYQIYQPGKLYSAWRGKKTNFLLDKGAVLSLDAKPFFSTKEKEGDSFKCLSIKSCHFKKGIVGSVQKTRALCRLHFTRLMFAWGGAGGLLLALLSGSRSYLENEVANAFRQAGLSHVLALSGMHLSLIGGLAFSLGKKSVGKKIAQALELFAIILFVWFAGKSPSLFRALLCSLIALISAFLKIKTGSSLNALALAFAIHISFFPNDAFELSFQLSYGALLGILLFNEIAAKNLTSLIPRSAGDSLGASTGAQIITMPLSLKVFGACAPGGILSSAVVSPFITIFVYSGIFFVLISLALPFMAPLCGGAMAFFYDFIKESVFFFANIPCLKI